MAISVFELFSIGIGPSSSHTVGPMRATAKFLQSHRDENRLDAVERIRVELFGSLGATGKGHGSDKAIIGGLSGLAPESADPDEMFALHDSVVEQKKLKLAGLREIEFNPKTDLTFSGKVLGQHSNAMRMTSTDAAGETILQKMYYSVGGGFVLDDQGLEKDIIVPDETPVPYPFTTAKRLLELCDEHGLSISTLMLKNEIALKHGSRRTGQPRGETEIRDELLEIWAVMQASVKRGCTQEGILPGGLKVKRRAAHLHRKLVGDPDSDMPLSIMDWVNLWAMAVNEENAAGGRVVTAPTNGAAGIIPAVLHFYHRFCLGANEEGTIRFLLTAAAIGTLYKINASISGADVGCQGEVGSACSMAAGALAEVLGGNPNQIENAAEIGMEHNLGLTCDPIGGLVQVPCIERNAMAAVKAINAARLALRGDGRHFVSLDKVIATMRETGKDMKTKYKETSRGGLAVNVIEC
jgi:L-serine dehydratase